MTEDYTEIMKFILMQLSKCGQNLSYKIIIKQNLNRLFDSDCMLPRRYLETVTEELMREDADAFGGADKADSSFTQTQKAINYSMTSFLTTGGIRGGKKKLDKSIHEALI